MGDRDDGADERVERLLERLGRREVEVVGRLVEQQQVAAGQLEQQDLQAGLLAARQRLERLLGAAVEPVAPQRRHRLAPLDARACITTSSTSTPRSSGWSWVWEK